MACPKCGCKVTYEYVEDDVLGLPDDQERCAACGHIFYFEDSADEDDEEDVTDMTDTKSPDISRISALKELIGTHIANLGYPVGMGIDPSDEHLTRMAEEINSATEALVVGADAVAALYRSSFHQAKDEGFKLLEELDFLKCSLDDERTLRIKFEKRVVELSEEVAQLKENTSQHCTLCEQAAKEVERLTLDLEFQKNGHCAAQIALIQHGLQIAPLTAALESTRSRVQWIQDRCAGDAMPRWEPSTRTTHSRGLILDRTNAALAAIDSALKGEKG